MIKIIKPGEETATFSMELPWGWLNDAANTMFYRMTRPGSHNHGDWIPVLNLLFHYPASTITVSHPPSVDPAQPGTGTFTLTRSYPRAYDEVTLTVGTWSKTIPYAHPANPITYTLTAADLQQIGDGTHPVSVRTVDQLGNSSVSPPSSIVIGTAPAEWVDHYTSLADAYNGWIPYHAARSGSIRPHVMGNQTVNAFFNFTDQGETNGFAGVILYQDFLSFPGNTSSRSRVLTSPTAATSQIWTTRPFTRPPACRNIPAFPVSSPRMVSGTCLPLNSPSPKKGRYACI
ncbi:hypothetical protein UG46_20595 [Pseudomonas fluorescens]|uniref:hypothetical protein n=1 Tax=Pseudomonas fluorescens TaxID=294 RepID=UPI0005DE3A66|nr:hypothetical protein [Pseudomonas fluorescens]KJH84547.1 hypothetical protein UG46_20595 [Pseudomonas fluorescens]